MGLETQEFEYLRQFLAQYSAVVLDESKDYLAESRLTPLAYREGMNSAQDLVACIRRTSFGGLHRKVLDAMMNNETWFFRDHLPFEALRQVILPELIAERETSRRINLWSAAASSGQEAYSIAMIIAEQFGGLPGWTISILGTDLSSAILERARSGRYSQLEVNRGLPAKYLAKYFTREGSDWVLCPAIRNMVEFRQFNLTEPWHTLPKFDIVFFRNVMIYFEVEKKRQILTRLVSAMKPDGYLLLGAAETTFGLSDSYSRTAWDKTAYYRMKM
ncbi:MAG TPA: protein-glutamate O-methyltransferase CheR [Candidatus Saccharimonadales bacterium]|nr:protein-glutamate O-methyltransferase CheR [Candidatus Saccharimonadales bacterium]